MGTVDRTKQPRSLAGDSPEEIHHSVPSALLVLDEDGLIQSANVASLSLLGCRRDELVGRPVSEIFPSGAPIMMSQLERLVPDRSTLRVRDAVRAQSGKLIPVLIGAAALLNDDGELDGAVLSFIELPQRSITPDELSHAHQLESVGQVTAGIAHEINTPVQFIEVWSWALLRLARSFSSYCRGTPVLTALVLIPLRFLWYRSWDVFFFLRIRLRGPLCNLSVHGFKLLVDLRDRVLARHLYTFKGYELDETELVKSLVREGMTVLDLGANIGYYTLMLSRLVGEHGRVVAFEPAPYNFELLTKSLEMNSIQNVIAIQSAVSDRREDVSLALSATSFGEHRIFKLGRNAAAPADVVTVGSVPVDEIVASRSLRPDFIKMDIEGADCLALRGMRRTLAANEHILMLCEVNPPALRDCGTDAEEFVSILRDMNFRFFEILERCHLKETSSQGLLAGIPAGKHVNILVSRHDPRPRMART